MDMLNCYHLYSPKSKQTYFFHHDKIHNAGTIIIVCFCFHFSCTCLFVNHLENDLFFQVCISLRGVFPLTYLFANRLHFLKKSYFF